MQLYTGNLDRGRKFINKAFASSIIFFEEEFYLTFHLSVIARLGLNSCLHTVRNCTSIA